MRAIIVLVAAVMLAGCASGPTPAEIAAIDYGQPVEQRAAEQQAAAYLGKVLKDPASAQVSFGKVYQGYYTGAPIRGSKISAGYMLDALVNAKNSYGGYTGAKPYRFLFQNGVMTGAWKVTQSGHLISI